MAEIQVFEKAGEDGECTLRHSAACEDGGGAITCYPLFDGVTVMRLHLETSGLVETRAQKGHIEVNFCVNGRFESDFSARDGVTLMPGDMAISLLDGERGGTSHSRFPLGFYEGICVEVDCERANAWLRSHAAPFFVDLNRLRDGLPAGAWYRVCAAGARREAAFRELYAALPYSGWAYLRLQTLEVITMLMRMPRDGADAAYQTAEQVALARHLREHLIRNQADYVSLEHLAREHHLSVSRMQQLFRQVFGVPVYRYIREYRLEQAAVALSQSELPITQIALDAGYSSASKFAECFRKRYGLSPSAFRAKAQSPAKME